MSILQPTYYTRHPDETYSVADPQPTIQPVKQEPVAWWNGKETVWFEHELITDGPVGECKIPLYAAPVRTKDLTDAEAEFAFERGGNELCLKLRAVIAADREKNK